MRIGKKMDLFHRNIVAEYNALAPSLFSIIRENRDDNILNFIRMQILCLKVKGHIEPIEAYLPVAEVDKTFIDRRDSNVQIFQSGPNNVQRLTLLGQSRGVIWIGENCVLKNVLVNANGHFGTIVFGPNTEITDMVLQISGRGSFLVCSGTTIPIGNFLIQEDGNFIVIGDDCMFSNNVSARTSDSHAIYDRKTRARINYGNPVIIHNHVWVGRYVTMNKGTEIGADAVVGQGALTSGFLKGSAIHAGHPAKPLREDIWWDRTTSETMDEAEVIHPSRTRPWNHVRTCKRIDSYGSQPLNGLSPLNAVSRLLAATFDDDHVEEFLYSNKENHIPMNHRVVAEAHKLRLRAVGSQIPEWLNRFSHD